MSIVWGTKCYEKDLGETNIQCTCENCRYNVRMIGKIIGKKFTLFWIPLFPVSYQHYVLCPVCNYGAKVTKNFIIENTQERISN